MNILILNWRDIKNPLSGGAEIVTLQHAKAWVKAGHTVDWFTSKFPGGKKNEIIEGVNIIRKGNPITLFLHVPLFYLFSNRRYNLVIDEIHGIPFLTPLYVRHKKLVFIHEVAEEIWDYMYSFPINKLGKMIEKVYFKLYKNVIFWTDAESTIKDLQRFGIKRSQCIAIPCPINNDVFLGKIEKEQEPTYIFVSRLVKMKGVEEVLKAFEYIMKQHKKAQLWLVGSGEKQYILSLQNMARSHGIHENVTFFGYVPEDKKLKLMRSAHILLHASVKEGWGLVVLEAASQGTPAVVYNNGSLKEVVKNGKTGIVVKKNISSLLAEEALSLYGDKKRYKDYQENGIAWVKSLKWEDVTKRSLDLISSI
jgi:glycosyltransferase involved in cell wall biosynthesis